jgi:hypothetical protein
MSLRFLYRKVPVSQRRCNYYRCQRPILRNIARDKAGHIYHYGCLQSALDEKFRCVNCLNVFDATEAAFDTKQIFKQGMFSERLQIMCPNCGGTNIKPSHMKEATSG